MKISITSVDCALKEIEEAVPIELNLLRQIPGPDRPDYWLGKLETPIRLTLDNQQQTIEYAIVSSRWVGRLIVPQAKQVPINLAFVFDESQVHEETIEFAKSKFLAIGIADEKSGPLLPRKQNGIIAGIVDKVYGKS